jgi:carboxymethylenebutenolidase
VDPRIVALYNEYVHGDMPRRQFIVRVSEIAGGAAAAGAVIALLEPDWVAARQVDPDDSRLETSYVYYPGTSGEVRAYMTRPAATRGKLPGILVIHENRGLNPHIEDVARRAAVEGYVALAPDGLSRAGGAPADQEAARDLFGKTDREAITADVIRGVPFLAAHESCNGSVGTVGFCYGGGVSLQCAARESAVAAAVCFYGQALSAEETAKVKASLMMHYAGTDERVNAGIPDFLTALNASGVAYSLHMYPGSGHGFHNDTSQARYDAAAAALAWRRTVRFFEDSLKK